MKCFYFLSAMLMFSSFAEAQMSNWQPDLTVQQTYTVHRVSSSDPTGGNRDWKPVEPGETVTVFDVSGPATISHIWFTMIAGESFYLKKLVLRMYWDGELTPSVEAPIGDFFGLGLGELHAWQSQLLSVGNLEGLNSFFPMPFARHAHITVTNEGKEKVDSLYYNIDYRAYSHQLPPNTVYFHAQYRQTQPSRGIDWWKPSSDYGDLDKRPNFDGAKNIVWMDAKGHGQFVGVTMSVIQNQDGWWGEGDDMFFIDGEKRPSIAGTGSEDYFLSSHDFQKPYSYDLYGAPVVGAELAGGRWSAYRFHLEAPIPFTQSIKATMEHGQANMRADNFYSVAYWYQAEPHSAFPPLPAVEERLPTLQAVGGPGNSGVNSQSH